MKELKGCVDHVVTRRKAGDARSLDEIIAESVRLFSSKEKTDLLHAEIKRDYQRSLRDICLETSRPEDELQNEPLPFEAKELSYRCGALIRVRRDGEIDSLKPHLVTGKEIERHDAWDVGQRRRVLAYSQDKQRHNKAVTLGIKPFGLAPESQTIGEMHAALDRRICALCGEGYIDGDPFEIDHETPIATEKGESVIGWAHRSCNRSKGKLEIDHLPIGK